MGGRVKTRHAALALSVAALSAPLAARADFVGVDPTSQGKVSARIDRPSHWLVGVTLDRAANPSRLDEERLLRDQFLGVSATYHRSWFGANARLMFTPSRFSPRTRAALVVGTRVAGRALGRMWSYGVNVQGEANLDDHHWMLHLSPVEIGADLYVRRSVHIQLFAGARYAAKGSMIRNFFIDPNGFPSETLEERLQDRLDSPWEGYVSLVYARRID